MDLEHEALNTENQTETNQNENTMTLEELLKETGEYSQAHPWGGFQIFVSDKNRAKYFSLSDYTVVASLAGPSLHLMPSDNPGAVVRAFFAY